MMDEKDKQILKGILEKKRDCVPLTREEQKFAEDTLGKLLNSKFKSRVFIVKTGDEMRGYQDKLSKGVVGEGAGKQTNVQPGDAISDERSTFGTKGKIKPEDNSGEVTDIEEGDNINVDEKRVGGEDDAQTEAQSENASDIINSDKEDLQRKPVLKYHDVVVKEVNGRKYAGLVVKMYPEHGIAQIKWANGTFSNSHVNDLELLTKAFGDEKPAFPPKKKDPKGQEAPADETPADETSEDPAEESAETPADEAAETPEEQAAEDQAGTEQHDASFGDQAKPSPDAGPVEFVKPGEEKAPAANGTADIKDANVAPVAPEKPAVPDSIATAVKEVKQMVTTQVMRAVEDELASDAEKQNEWVAKCVEGVSKNASVKNPGALCTLAYNKVSKSADGKVSLSKAEIAKDNPELAKYMEDNGHESLSFETKPEVK